MKLSVFPPAQWLAGYQAGWLRHDVIAGVTLAAYAIPVSMAYASLAGLPPQYGIYCYLVAGPAYALFGSSRQLALGPTSAPSRSRSFLLAYIEGVSAARTLAQRHGYEIDPRQELLGLSAANTAAAFGQGYPVAGGLSQSSVNDKAGAKTPLALGFASLAIGLTLLYLTGLLTNLPNVVLAAIVLVAVKGLIDIPALRRVRRLSRVEFGVAAAAFAGVLLLGILKGVLLAAIVSMLLLIARAAKPHVARLGRIPGTRRYSDCERNPENAPIPGVLIVRVEAGLLYFNTSHVRDRVRALVAAEGEGLRLVVWDLSATPHVDIAGARLLQDAQAELAARDVRLRIVEAHASVRDLLREELGASVGEISRRVTLDDVIAGEGSARVGTDPAGRPGPVPTG